MKTCKLWVTFLLAVAMLLPAGFVFGQGRMADIETAKADLAANRNFGTLLRLGTLQYLQGVDALKAGNLKDAIDSLQAGVWTLEDGKGMVPETHPVFEEARYGLAYALLRNNSPHEALLVLDQTVNVSPGFDKARYLLGVTLVNIPGEQNLSRGIDVMRDLADDGDAPYQVMAAHAATRYGYDISTLKHATGNAAGAMQTVSNVTDTVGANMGADKAENVKVRYGMGVYLKDQNDLFGAMEHLEAAYAMDAGYRLNNGVALSGVLSNTYYGAGLNQLALGGEASDHVAAQMFASALEVGDSKAVDALHGQAVAYAKLGDKENALSAAQKLYAADKAYYEKVKAK